MTDNTLNAGVTSTPAYKVAYSMYVAVGGDPTVTFETVEDIYTALNAEYSKGNNRVNIERVDVEYTENGDYIFDSEEVTGYKPVNIKVEVPQKYTDEQVENIRVEAETTGYNNGYGVGYAEGDIAGQQTGYNTGYTEGFEAGEDDGYADGYAEGLDDGAEDQKALLEDITITANGVYEKEDGYKKVTVEIENTGGGDGFDFSVIGYDTAYSNQLNNELRSATQDAIDYSKQMYDNWDPNVTSLRSKFSNDTKLKYFPMVSTSSVTDMYQMFYECSSLTSIPQLDTSSVTEMYQMFSYCSSLTSIPQLDTSSVRTMERMFYECSSLTSIPQLDTSSVRSMGNMFRGCSSLTSIPELDCNKVTNTGSMFYRCTALTDVGGLKNLGMQSSLNTGSMFSNCYNLTHDSVMNIINNLYDRASAGYSVVTLPFGSTNLARISDEEKAIATNKGWTLS